MANLTRASQELFRRSPDECFPSLSVLSQHCLWQKEQAVELWQPPRAIGTSAVSGGTLMLANGDGPDRYRLNDWSFSQLCRLAGVAKETVSRAGERNDSPPAGNPPKKRVFFVRMVAPSSQQRLRTCLRPPPGNSRAERWRSDWRMYRQRRRDAG